MNNNSSTLQASTPERDDSMILSGKAPVGRSRLELVDCLRGLAALAVCWYHVTQGGKILRFPWLARASEQGWLGVETFFVISGFIIPWVMMQDGYVIGDYRRFIAKRMTRLQLPYVLACVMTLLLNFASAHAPGFKGQALELSAGGALKALVRDFFYASGWMGHPWIIVVAWTLAIEVQFYLLAGLVFPLLRANRGWLTASGLLGLGAVSFVWTDARGVGHYLPLFLLGWSLSLVVFARAKGCGYLPFAAAGLGCAAMLVPIQGFAVLAVACLTALAIVMGQDIRPVSALAWLGAISYSLYLIHVPVAGRVINLGLRFTTNGISRLLLAVVALATCLFAAWLFRRWAELPAIRWSRASFGNIGRSVP